jgi:hypothetical protein
MKFLKGESTTRAFGFGLTAGFVDTSAFGFTITLALVFAFAFGFAVDFAVDDFAAVGFAAAVFFRIFAAICLIRSSPNRWPLVVRGRGPRNEGRVRYQNISAAARKIGALNWLLNLSRIRPESASANGAKACPIVDQRAQRRPSDNRTIEGLTLRFAFSRGRFC